MKRLFFLLVLLFSNFLLEAENNNSVFYSNENSYLVKTTRYKEEVFIDSVVKGIIYKSTQIYDQIQTLGEIPEELNNFSDSKLDSLIKTKTPIVFSHNSNFNYGHLQRYEKIFVFSDKEGRFIKDIKYESSIKGFYLHFIQTAFFIALILMQRGRNLTLNKYNLYIASFFVVIIYLFFNILLLYFYFDQGIFFWFNLPNLSVSILYLIILYLQNKFFENKLKRSKLRLAT